MKDMRMIWPKVTTVSTNRAVGSLLKLYYFALYAVYTVERLQ